MQLSTFRRFYPPSFPLPTLSPYVPPGERLERLFLLLCLSDAAASKNMIATSEPARPAE